MTLKVKKIAVWILCLSMALILNLGPSAAYCASSTTFQVGKTPISFRWYVGYDWYTKRDWKGGTDVGSDWLAKNKKIDIGFFGPNGAASLKLSTMMVSDALPEVMTLERGQDVEKLFNARKLVALDKYIPKYPNLKKWAGSVTLNMLKSKDGQLYQFPNWYIGGPNGNGNTGYLVNQKIWKELGRPSLKTTDDLYNYLKLVKQKYPNVIPLNPGIECHGVNYIYNAFKENAYVVNRTAYVSGNKLDYVFKDPAYQEYMTFVNRLFKEKLIAQNAFTQTLEQATEKLNRGEIAVYIAGDIIGPGRTANGLLKAKNYTSGNAYEAIWPVCKKGLDPSKARTTGFVRLGWNVAVITKAAKNPEQIFAVLDYLTGEEAQRALTFGPPGLFYDSVDSYGAPIFNAKYEKALSDKSEVLSNLAQNNWVGNATFVDTSKGRAAMRLKNQDWGLVTQINNTWKTTFDVTEFQNLIPSPSLPEGKIYISGDDIAKATFAKMIFARNSSDLQDEFKMAIKKLDSIGYQKVLNYMTKKWQENRRVISGR